jgi:hypothetical protein
MLSLMLRLLQKERLILQQLGINKTIYFLQKSKGDFLISLFHEYDNDFTCKFKRLNLQKTLFY